MCKSTYGIILILQKILKYMLISLCIRLSTYQSSLNSPPTAFLYTTKAAVYTTSPLSPSFCSLCAIIADSNYVCRQELGDHYRHWHCCYGNTIMSDYFQVLLR